MKISVIIPTFKSPQALDLCLQSIVEGQAYENQIIVVVDGFFKINEEILSKWGKHIDVLNLEENVGTPRATNLGVYNACHDLILIANDDNVFPKNFDKRLLDSYTSGTVLAPNQIEPFPSMFTQFVIKDLGRDPKTFDLKCGFWDYELTLRHPDRIEETGSTLPIFMNKTDYLRVGGMDETYPGGWVVDHDFFLKCQLSGMKMLRTYNCHFYHFVSLSTKTPDIIEKNQIIEGECHEYAKYKWGSYIKHNGENNLKYL